jgi:hypothetical protein
MRYNEEWPTSKKSTCQKHQPDSFGHFYVCIDFLVVGFFWSWPLAPKASILKKFLVKLLLQPS